MDHQTMGGMRIRPTWFVAAGLAVLALVAMGVPLVSLLYVGILLLCPLLMAGMHGGHGQAHGHEHPHSRMAASTSSWASASCITSENGNGPWVRRGASFGSKAV